MNNMQTREKVSFFCNSLLLAILCTLLAPAVCQAFSPVARFDVVPYQRIKYGGSIKVGVIAFSKARIDTVKFSATGQGYSGGIKTVTSMTLNDQTGVWEYWATFSAGEFTGNGEITINATVTDKSANTRNLTLPMIAEGASAFVPVTCWADSVAGNNTTCTAGSSSKPCANVATCVSKIQAANGGNSNGAIIYLKEGTYSVSGVTASTTSEWLTITKDAAAVRDNVIINAGQLTTGYLKYDSVTLQSKGSGLYVASTSSTRLWTNNCRRIGSGRWVLNSNPVNHSTDNHYSTNDYTYDIDVAYRIAALVRGATISTIGMDMFQNTRFVVNVTADNQDNGTTGWHADAFQVHTTGQPPADNRIVYNYKATGVRYQGFFMRSDAGLATDNAFVNVFVEMREPASLNEVAEPIFTAFSMYQSWDHMLVWNCTFLGGHAEVYPSSLTNSSFVGNVFYALLNTSTAPGVTSVPFAANGNSGGNEFLYNNYMNVNGVTPACTPNSSYVFHNWPCPHWYAKSPDSGSSPTYIIGDKVDTDFNSSTFGYPDAGSSLIDGVLVPTVPVDVNGKARVGNPDVGAVERTTGTAPPPPAPPPPLSTPSGFQLGM